MSSESGKPIGTRLLFGFILAFLGVVFILDNMALIDADEIWRFWPLALIAIGVVKLVQPRGSGKLFAIFLIVAGVWLQLDKVGFIVFGFEYFWPLLLVFFGVSLVVGALNRRGRSGRDATDDAYVSMTAVLGGTEQRVNSQRFTGGDGTAIMGGVELHLVDADIEGTEATFDCFALMGSVEFRVPKHWSIVMRGTPIMGSFENKTAQVVQEGTSEKRLVIKGTAIMGSVEVKN
jgi:predicted membrane protein